MKTRQTVKVWRVWVVEYKRDRAPCFAGPFRTRRLATIWMNDNCHWAPGAFRVAQYVRAPSPKRKAKKR